MRRPRPLRRESSDTALHPPRSPGRPVTPRRVAVPQEHLIQQATHNWLGFPPSRRAEAERRRDQSGSSVGPLLSLAPPPRAEDAKEWKNSSLDGRFEVTIASQVVLPPLLHGGRFGIV